MTNNFVLKTKGRVMIFIDAANILYSQKDIGWKVDYEKLKKYFDKNSDLKKIFYYTGKVGTLEGQTKFLNKLMNLGINVVAKEVKMIRIANNKYLPKGNLDIELALDVYRNISNFDTILLFSGDSDYAYLLDLLIEEKKKIIVVSTRGHISKELIERSLYLDIKLMR